MFTSNITVISLQFVGIPPETSQSHNIREQYQSLSNTAIPQSLSCTRRKRLHHYKCHSTCLLSECPRCCTELAERKGINLNGLEYSWSHILAIQLSKTHHQLICIIYEKNVLDPLTQTNSTLFQNCMQAAYGMRNAGVSSASPAVAAAAGAVVSSSQDT